jgi:hypothetical protein
MLVHVVMLLMTRHSRTATAGSRSTVHEELSRAPTPRWLSKVHPAATADATTITAAECDAKATATEAASNAAVAVSCLIHRSITADSLIAADPQPQPVKAGKWR